MKNKNNIFGFSGTLFMQNMRLHWYLPAIIFAMYFVSGVFPKIVRPTGTYTNVVTLLNPGYLLVMMFAPLIVSCVMMRFYHKPEQSFAMHSQPYTRSKLFNTQVVTGWIMLVAPILITGILFFVLGDGDKIVPNVEMDITGSTDGLYTYNDAFWWTLTTISVISFLYFMYTLAGSIVGTTVMQLFFAAIFSHSFLRCSDFLIYTVTSL